MKKLMMMKLRICKDGETKPKITDPEMTGSDQFRNGPRSRLNPPIRKPTNQEKKKITAIAMGWLVKHIMTNFLYTFGGEDRRQEGGGPMGSDLTQALSRLIGNEFDEMFLENVEKIGMIIEMYKRYGDDQNVAGRSIGKETKVCLLAGKLVRKTDEEIRNDKDKRLDEIFMNELRKIADNTMKMLKTEADSPANHPELDFKVPILDLAVWVEDVSMAAPGVEDQNIHSRCEGGMCLPIGSPPRRRMEGGPLPAPRMVQQVYYEFYSKPMLLKRTILASSALPWQQKRTVLTQELIRRLIRTKKELPCQIKQKILSSFMQILINSGYNFKFRKEILNSGLNGYNKILQQSQNGTKPIFRSKEWRASSRRLETQRKRKNWLGSYKSCIYVPPTPGAKLRKIMQEKERQLRPGGREEWHIKIIEMAGKTLERCLVKVDPFNGNRCTDKSCLPAQNPKKQNIV